MKYPSDPFDPHTDGAGNGGAAVIILVAVVLAFPLMLVMAWLAR